MKLIQKLEVNIFNECGIWWGSLFTLASMLDNLINIFVEPFGYSFSSYTYVYDYWDEKTTNDLWNMFMRQNNNIKWDKTIEQDNKEK